MAKKKKAVGPGRPRMELDRSTPRGEMGARLRAARDKRGLDLQSVAIAAGITVPALQKIETGQNDTRVGTLLQICRAIGADPAAMVRGLPELPEAADPE